MRRALRVLARELREHHLPTAQHSHRLASLCRRVAEAMGLDPMAAFEAEIVAVVHDVGKLAVDPATLDARGVLSDAQRKELWRHTIAGEEILLQTAGLEHLGPLVRATHEWWDGNGYPDGISGEDIPIEARIVGAADAFDAMTSHRAYRPALPRSEACRRIWQGSGGQFDPSVVEALLVVVCDD